MTDKINQELFKNDIILYSINNELREGIITEFIQDKIQVNSCKKLINPKNSVCINLLTKSKKNLLDHNFLNIKKNNEKFNEKIYLFYCILNNGEDGLCLFKPKYLGLKSFLETYKNLNDFYNNEVDIFPLSKEIKDDILFNFYKIKKSKTVYNIINKLEIFNDGIENKINMSIKKMLTINMNKLNSLKFPIELNKIHKFEFITDLNSNISLDFCSTNYSNFFLETLKIIDFKDMLIYFWKIYLPTLKELKLKYINNKNKIFNILDSSRIKYQTFEKYLN